jgi:hypothetical protein
MQDDGRVEGNGEPERWNDFDAAALFVFAVVMLVLLALGLTK